MVVAIAAITIAQMISAAIYPMPEGVTIDNEEAFNAYVGTLPITAFLLVILGYMLGSFLGGLAATMIAKAKFAPALIVGTLLAIAAFLNGMAMPQPLWISALGVLVMIPMAWLGARLVKLD